MIIHENQNSPLKSYKEQQLRYVINTVSQILTKKIMGGGTTTKSTDNQRKWKIGANKTYLQNLIHLEISSLHRTCLCRKYGNSFIPNININHFLRQYRKYVAVQVSGISIFCTKKQLIYILVHSQLSLLLTTGTELKMCMVLEHLQSNLRWE